MNHSPAPGIMPIHIERASARAPFYELDQSAQCRRLRTALKAIRIVQLTPQPSDLILSLGILSALMPEYEWRISGATIEQLKNGVVGPWLEDATVERIAGAIEVLLRKREQGQSDSAICEECGLLTRDYEGERRCRCNEPECDEEGN